jgi:hypothetical protein
MNESEVLADAFGKTVEETLLDFSVMGQDHLLQEGAAAYKGKIPAHLYMRMIATPVGGIPPQVVDAAMKRIWDDGINLSTRIWRLSNGLRQELEDRLVIGIVQGRSFPKLAKEIRDAYGVKYHEAVRLVRTEGLQVYNDGYVETAKEKDFVKGIKWRRAKTIRECPSGECDRLESADDYGLGPGVYPKDKVPSRPHPNCGCKLMSALMDEDELIGHLKKKYPLLSD